MLAPFWSNFYLELHPKPVQKRETFAPLHQKLCKFSSWSPNMIKFSGKVRRFWLVVWSVLARPQTQSGSKSAKKRSRKKIYIAVFCRGKNWPYLQRSQRLLFFALAYHQLPLKCFVCFLSLQASASCVFSLPASGIITCTSIWRISVLHGADLGQVHKNA